MKNDMTLQITHVGDNCTGLISTSDMLNDRGNEDDDLPGTLNFWCKMRYWEPHEAAALVLGFLPTDLTEEMAESPAFISLEKLITRISSKKTPKPSFVLARLRKLKVDVPEHLLKMCRKYNKSYNSRSMSNSELRQELDELRQWCQTLDDYSNGKEKKNIMIMAYAALTLKYGTGNIDLKKAGGDLDTRVMELGYKMGKRTVDKWLRAIIDMRPDPDEKPRT